MEIQSNNIQQNIILENRKKMIISGVTDVGSYDENHIIVDTVKGTITVKGTKLHIEKLSVETGEIQITGLIIALVYSDERTKENGFLGRLFR